MKYYDRLHPICLFTYFVFVIGITAVSMNPIMVGISFVGATCFLAEIKGMKTLIIWARFVLPLMIIIALFNPLFNHKGVTPLFLLFNQWITLEAILYGITAGLALASLILWFACYQQVMSSDRFLYLFGRIAPATALLVDMAMQMTTTLKQKLDRIQESQKMIYGEPKSLREKFMTGIRNTQSLLSWGMEDSVHTADSMKARGYGIKKRTNFHLFKFETSDAFVLAGVVIIGGTVILARCLGFSGMCFYPQIIFPDMNQGNLLSYIAYACLSWMPACMEERNRKVWRSYNLNN